MSDAESSARDEADYKIRGHSELVVLLGASEGIRAVTKKLVLLDGVVRARRGVFIVESHSSEYLSLIEDIPHVSLVKTREIPAARTQQEDPPVARAFSVLSYSFKNPSSKQKKRVERLVRRSVSVRLRPGVLIFPVLRAKEKRRLLEPEGTPSLLDSRKLGVELSSMGGNVLRWSRLRLSSQDGPALVTQAVERTLSGDLFQIESKLKDLRERIKNSETSTKTISTRYRLLARRFREVRFKWERAGKIWRYNPSKKLKRTYNMLLSVRRYFETRID
ncbi:MAG: hypothetical protein ACFFC0_07935 [Promethearchaeota archaeon]